MRMLICPELNAGLFSKRIDSEDNGFLHGMVTSTTGHRYVARIDTKNFQLVPVVADAAKQAGARCNDENMSDTMTPKKRLR